MPAPAFSTAQAAPPPPAVATSTPPPPPPRPTHTHSHRTSLSPEQPLPPHPYICPRRTQTLSPLLQLSYMATDQPDVAAATAQAALVLAGERATLLPHAPDVAGAVAGLHFLRGAAHRAAGDAAAAHAAYNAALAAQGASTAVGSAVRVARILQGLAVRARRGSTSTPRFASPPPSCADARRPPMHPCERDGVCRALCACMCAEWAGVGGGLACGRSRTAPTGRLPATSLRRVNTATSVRTPTPQHP